VERERENEVDGERENEYVHNSSDESCSFFFIFINHPVSNNIYDIIIITTL